MLRQNETVWNKIILDGKYSWSKPSTSYVHQILKGILEVVLTGSIEHNLFSAYNIIKLHL